MRPSFTESNVLTCLNEVFTLAVLLVSDFSTGGTVSTITVYRWNTACTKSGQVLSNGNTCGDVNLEQLATSNAANCKTASPNDTFCGLVNAGTITMPWSFKDKSGTPANGALNGEFYEGGQPRHGHLRPSDGDIGRPLLLAGRLLRRPRAEHHRLE